MSVALYTAPAGAGKTEFLINLPYPGDGVTCVCVPSSLQAQRWRHRLARHASENAGARGSLGIRVLTFDQLVDHSLQSAAIPYVELSEPILFRLLRDILASIPLTHYAPIRGKPGLAGLLQSFIGEMKAGQIAPDAFRNAVAQMGSPARLQELGAIYAEYQRKLLERKWADRAGRIWLAAEQLPGVPAIARDWPRLILDGFDNFSAAQLTLIELLAGRVDTCIIALTLPNREPERYQRFLRTCRQLEKRFSIEAQPLSIDDAPSTVASLHRLGRALFLPEQSEISPADDEIELWAVADQAAEARGALRWLKRQMVQRNLEPRDVAVVARDLAPYRPHLQQNAREMGLPLRLVDGLPLSRNPAVSALLNLLRLFLPAGDEDGDPSLPRRPLLNAWRSPYFDWETCRPAGEEDPVGIQPGEADYLDALSRRRQIVGGLDEWRRGLAWLVEASGENSMEESLDEDRDAFPALLPRGSKAVQLRQRLERFVKAVCPPAGSHPLPTYIAWLEKLIGSPTVDDDPPASLGLARRTQATPDPDLAQRDLAALKSLKEIMRSLLWVARTTGNPSPHTYAEFLSEIGGAVDAALYLPPHLNQENAVLAANVIQVRGLPFRAMALLGLGEGLFPAVVREDPVLRDDDRRQMQEMELEIELSTASDERSFFYETINRPTDALLVTRPRLAENGASWVPSPFWREIVRLTEVSPREVGDAYPPPAEACSPVELLESAVVYDAPEARAWLGEHTPDLLDAATRAAAIAGARIQRRATPYDGDLRHMTESLSAHVGPDRPWSASRLESYLTCGYFFFVSRLLGIEPRAEPGEELGARQSGTIYHEIFETLYDDYRRLKMTETDDAVRALVEEIAIPLLDTAPEKEGFRPTAWWEQTKEEMIENVVLSVLALRELDGDFEPEETEAYFKNLILRDGDETFRLRGLVDRVDRTEDGRLRIIDYKLGGPYSYGRRALEQGKKLQLPLYALAVAEDLRMGRVADGFYWHVRHQQASSLTLASYGLEEAIAVARRYAWQAVRGARSGDFSPTPPADGCPPYCPAAAFCWHYAPGYIR